METTEQNKWVASLSDEDLRFIKKFILASGSLKEMAKIYDISYPTMRLRLDRLIAKVQVLDNDQISSEFERTLRARYAEGKLDVETLKELLTLHRKEKGTK